MKLSLRYLTLSLMLGALSSYGYDLTCESNYLAVDGGLVKLQVAGDKDGKVFTLDLHKESASPLGTSKSDVHLVGLSCTFPSTDKRELDCTGVSTTLSSRIVQNDFRGKTVEIHHGKDIYVFQEEPQKSGPTRDGCELKP